MKNHIILILILLMWSVVKTANLDSIGKLLVRGNAVETLEGIWMSKETTFAHGGKANMKKIDPQTMKALYDMGRKAHMNNYSGVAFSVFSDFPCTKCMDGGIDMLHCEKCDRSNGFIYFRKKV